MIPFVHALIFLKVFQALNSVVYILNLMRNYKLNPLKTYVAYEMFWGEVILCLIFVLILSWGCIICDTCSVPFMVLYSSHIIHVAPMIQDHLVCYA